MPLAVVDEVAWLKASQPGQLEKSSAKFSGSKQVEDMLDGVIFRSCSRQFRPWLADGLRASSGR